MNTSLRNAIMLLLVAVVGSLALVAAPSSQADSAGVPFAKNGPALNKCSDDPRTYANRYAGRTSRAATEKDTKNWYYVGETRSQTGHLVTREFVKNSYRDYDTYHRCQAKYWHIDTVPVQHVYKSRYVNLNCYGGGCRLLYTKTTGWKNGYCYKGASGKVCGFKD